MSDYGGVLKKLGMFSDVKHLYLYVVWRNIADVL